MSALRALAREATERVGPEVRFEHVDGDPGLSPESTLTAYRAAQAALRACGRGEDVDGALVMTLARGEGRVVLELRAEAGGLEVSTSPEAGVAGLELFAVSERARFSGGDLSVDRGPSGQARAIRVTLPTAG